MGRNPFSRPSHSEFYHDSCRKSSAFQKEKQRKLKVEKPACLCTYIAAAQVNSLFQFENVLKGQQQQQQKKPTVVITEAS